MTPTASSMRMLVAVPLLAAIALPWLATGFVTFQATQILVYAIAILGLNLLMGYNGQISLGHGAFYAIGAYAVAILMAAGVPYWIAIPLAGAIGFAAGYLFGLPALRLEGHYLALATFALALAVPQLIKHPALESWTGGIQGVFVTKPAGQLGLNADRWLYYVVLLFTVLAFAGVSNLVQGRVGRAVAAIRDHPLAAESLGVHVARFKTLVFGVSALCTALAGGLSAVVVQFVAPGSFDMFLSVFLFVGAVVGGSGSIAGAFLGAAFIVLVPNLASDISKAATGSVYAVMLLAMVYVMPQGMWGALRSGAARLSRKPGTAAPPPPVHPTPERKTS